MHKLVFAAQINHTNGRLLRIVAWFKLSLVVASRFRFDFEKTCCLCSFSSPRSSGGVTWHGYRALNGSAKLPVGDAGGAAVRPSRT